MSAESNLPSQETTSEAPVGVLGTLGINGTQFIAQLLSFTILVLIMWRFVFKPLMKAMDDRSKKINDGLAFSKEANVRLGEANAEKERVLRDAKNEASRTIEQAAMKAEAVRHEKMVQAKAEIEKVIAEAKEQIKQERAAAFQALKADIAQIVSLATEKVALEMNEKSQKTLIQQALKEIERA